jgi:OOP family OmpA-OmpF porin
MKHLFIFIAFTAGTAGAQPGSVSASGAAVTSGYGETWRTHEWNRTHASEVLFDFGAADLRADARKELDDLAQKVMANEVERVMATAHADRLGDAGYNQRLSERRAEAVRAYLVKQGVPPEQVHVDVLGTRAPATRGRCSDLGEETRRNAKLVACLQPDRRVEIQSQ